MRLKAKDLAEADWKQLTLDSYHFSERDKEMWIDGFVWAFKAYAQEVAKKLKYMEIAYDRERKKNEQLRSATPSHQMREENKPMTQEATIEGNKREKCHWHKGSNLGYIAFFEDCEKRAAKGQEQKQCPICLYWFWPDKMGRMPKTTTAHLNDPEGGRKDKKVKV
jgi:hypothetical protein